MNLLKGTLAKCNNEVDCNIKDQVEEAVINSVEDWYNFILDKMPIESNRAMRIKNLTNLANILGKNQSSLKMIKQDLIEGQDLREGCESSHTQFKESLNINYRQLCYRTYEKQLVELCRDFVEETCDK